MKVQNFQILEHCPATGEQVLGNGVIHFSIHGNKGVWWCCPVCQGWHVTILEEVCPAEEVFKPKLSRCIQPA
ncbi:MAG: hypothetical protein JW953_03950 [Anaerolineae bacterium]|nr:hypothetical protein [Anaerolineae bacterium]